jgi:spore coat protein A, manganese oxidase
VNRRQFLKLGGAAGAALLAPRAWSPAAARAENAEAVRLVGAAYEAKFQAPLPRPRRVDLTNCRAPVAADMVQFRQQVLDGYPATTLWGYQHAGGPPTWPGATIVAKSGHPIDMTWRNGLPIGTGDLAASHILPVDETLMIPEGLNPGHIPTVTHLHGGHTESASDGQPDGWFTQGFDQKGEMWSKATYHYANDQGAGTLWYHDHTLGITRLNVFAGLSGMYLLRDDQELGLIAGGVLPGDPYEVELLFQDRWFKDDGSLDLSTTTDPPDGITASIFADFMMVNGKPWPVLDVEPRKYRFRMLNGCDSRFLVLRLDDADASLLRVGTDLGLAPAAVEVARLPMGPAERYDIVIDFSAYAGKELVLRNDGVDGAFRGFRNAAGVATNNPSDIAFGFGTAVDPATTGQIMKFRVAQTKSGRPDATVAAGTALGGALPALTPTNTRSVMTFNGRDSLNRGMEMQGSIADGTMMWMDPVTENPAFDAVEVWEIHNTGPVAHPIHIHLVDFQLLDRQPFTFTATPKEMMLHDGTTGTGATLSDIARTGTARGPETWEVGRKDTVIAYPGEVTRVVAKFDLPGRYVWHCHILHHEDHDMMRPFEVQAPPPPSGGGGGGHTPPPAHHEPPHHHAPHRPKHKPKPKPKPRKPSRHAAHKPTRRPARPSRGRTSPTRRKR